MITDVNTPAKFLTGEILNDGWVVGENISKSFEYDAKSFSETYLVEKEGHVALLKALDFSIALLDKDPTGALIQLSKSYDFEKELLELCKSERLSRIINIITQGNIPPSPGSIIPVPYFILEYAEKDIKSQIEFDSRFNTAWLLRILHNVTVGLWQLHKHGVAHTNIRPENILEFNKKLQKITRLGGADIKGIRNPILESSVLVDPAYITPEYLYGQNETDWVYNSQAKDVYHLGSLIFFLFTQSNFNSWLFYFLDELNPNYRPGKWGGTFDDVLPYLVDAYDTAIYFFTAYVEDEELKNDLEITLRQLCHPDPKRRGHPKNILSIGSSMSVERFISMFDRLAKMAEINLSNRS